MKKIVLFNGSPQGRKGNCQKLIHQIQKSLKSQASLEVIHLSEKRSLKPVLEKFKAADGFIFVTGTYWDSWGSPLQKLLEDMTALEGCVDLLGKPCAVFVLMHSVGGKGVLSRLQGVLSTMGFLIPPMGGMVYSLASDLALKNSKSSHKDDFWALDDIHRILKNLLLSLEIKVAWQVWPVDSKNFRKLWL